MNSNSKSKIVRKRMVSTLKCIEKAMSKMLEIKHKSELKAIVIAEQEKVL